MRNFAGRESRQAQFDAGPLAFRKLSQERHDLPRFFGAYRGVFRGSRCIDETGCEQFSVGPIEREVVTVPAPGIDNRVMDDKKRASCET